MNTNVHEDETFPLVHAYLSFSFSLSHIYQRINVEVAVPRWPASPALRPLAAARIEVFAPAMKQSCSTEESSSQRLEGFVLSWEDWLPRQSGIRRVITEEEHSCCP